MYQLRCCGKLSLGPALRNAPYSDGAVRGCGQAGLKAVADYSLLALAALLEAEAVAVHLQNMNMMREPVEERAGRFTERLAASFGKPCLGRFELVDRKRPHCRWHQKAEALEHRGEEFIVGHAGDSFEIEKMPHAEP